LKTMLWETVDEDPFERQIQSCTSRQRNLVHASSSTVIVVCVWRPMCVQCCSSINRGTQNHLTWVCDKVQGKVTASHIMKIKCDEEPEEIAELNQYTEQVQ
jgi:hypothetical protein